MASVVEIRVHGVGGTPPWNLLGEASADDVTRIGGSGESAFYRRTADSSGEVEGYAWGALTSKPLLQPLWILLLPFTLANAAGWMIPAPSRARRFVFWTLARRWVYALGALLTAGYALAISVIVVKQLFYQWGSTWTWFQWLADRPELRVALGGVVSAGVGSLFAHMARRTQRGFEGVNGPLGKPSSPDDVRVFQLRVGGARRVEVDQDLRDEEFWSRARRARTLLKVHWLVWMAAVAVYTIVAAGNAGALGAGEGSTPLPNLDTGVLFAVLGFAQVASLLGLLLTLWFGFHDPVGAFVTGYFRVLGPCITFSTAISLAAGFFSALATTTGRTLQGFSSKNEVLGLAGREYDLDVAFGVGTLTFVAALVALVVDRLRHAGRIARDIRASGVPPVNTAGSFAWPNGLPDQKVGAVARTRAFALAIRKSDLVLSLPAFPFAVLAFWTLLSMVDWASPPEETLPWLTPLDGFGGTVTGLGIAALGGSLLHGYFKDSRRRTIGIVWDILTFWPRRFHPLAVRPYAERAVPELQCRIVHHLEEDPGRYVVLSAHSQGTILAYAALAQLAEHRPRLTERVSLLTYGAPLTRLHSCFFPGYFDPAGFARLYGELCPGEVEIDGKRVPLAWRSFYRLTDYIGQRVELDPAPAVDPNVEVDDPPSTKPDADPVYFERPDPLRTAWIDLVMHSDYNSEIVMKEWSRRVRETLT